MKRKKPLVVVTPSRYPCSMATKRSAEILQMFLDDAMPAIGKRLQRKLKRWVLYGRMR